jgi:hypothetical protein
MSERQKRMLTTAVLTAPAFLLAGCVVYSSHGLVSAPTTPCCKGWNAGNYYWTHRSEALVINVDAANFKAVEGGDVGGLPSRADPTHLVIWIRIRAQTAIERARAGEQYGTSFDPLAVSLAKDDGEEIAPAFFSYTEVGYANTVSPRGAECNGPAYSLGTSEMVIRRWSKTDGVYQSLHDASGTMPAPLSIEGRVCIGLGFKVEPSPAESFTLTIEGFSQGGVPVSLSPIHFERAEYKIKVGVLDEGPPVPVVHAQRSRTDN